MQDHLEMEQLSHFQLFDGMYESTEILWFCLTVGMKLTIMYIHKVLMLMPTIEK
jgi:hypothetical protein